MEREPAAELTTSDLAGRAEDEPLTRDEAATDREASPLFDGSESEDIESRWAEVQDRVRRRAARGRRAGGRAGRRADAAPGGDVRLGAVAARVAVDTARRSRRRISRVALTRYRSFFRRFLSA